MRNNAKRLGLPIFISVLVFLSACQVGLHSETGTSTTVIMIRHADRTPLGFELTERGRKNAQALVDAIGHMKIDAIYSPDLARNLYTVQPLAQHLGIEITKVDSDVDVDSVAFTFIEKHSGQTVMWVGNTSNLPGIYQRLGGEGRAPVEYGELFILTIPDHGDIRVVKKTWGKNDGNK